MAITIDSLQINSTATAIEATVSTTGSDITNIYAYTKYSNATAIDLTSLVDGGFVFTISNTDLDVEAISDIWYIEFISDDTTNNSVLGLVANFAKVQECLLNKTLAIEVSDCDKITYDGCPDCEGNMELFSLLVDNLYIAINLNFLNEADHIIEKLNEMCPICDTCPTYTETLVVPGYGYATLNSVITRV